MLASNKNLIRELYLNHINQHDLTGVGKIISENYYDLSSGGKGLESYRNNIKNLMSGFPDVRFEILEMIEEGNKLVVRWKWTGTHNGVFAQIPATGKRVENFGVAIFTIADGKVANSWTLVDRLGVMNQLR